MRVMTTLQGELESMELVMRSESSPHLIELNRRELDAAFVRPNAEVFALAAGADRAEAENLVNPGTGRNRPLADSKQTTPGHRRLLPDFFLAFSTSPDCDRPSPYSRNFRINSVNIAARFPHQTIALRL
jgi:hypothetical protein